MSISTVRALLLFSALVLLEGCAVSPEVSAEALSVGIGGSIVLRRMLTDGTWPQQLRLSDPLKSILAFVLAGVVAMLMAKSQGASWSAAMMVGFSGLPAILMGIVEKTLPQGASGSTTAAAGSTVQALPKV